MCAAGYASNSTSGIKCSECAAGFYKDTMDNCLGKVQSRRPHHKLTRSMPAWLRVMLTAGRNGGRAILYLLHHGVDLVIRHLSDLRAEWYLQPRALFRCDRWVLQQVSFNACSSSELCSSASCSPACASCTGPATTDCLACASPRVNLNGGCVGFTASTGVCDSSLSGLQGTYLVNNAKNRCDGALLMRSGDR